MELNLLRRSLQKAFFVRLRLRGICNRSIFRIVGWIWGGKLTLGRRIRMQVPLRCAGNRGQLVIGDNNIFGYWGARRQGNGAILLTALRSDARIVIGNRNQFSNNVSISALKEVTIGDDFLCGDGVVISDADFHEISPELRLAGGGHGIAAPVHIGNNIWVGSQATILKGVTIGDGAVIAAGSIVTRDVPPRVLVGGIPAKIIKQI